MGSFNDTGSIFMKIASDRAHGVEFKFELSRGKLVKVHSLIGATHHNLLVNVDYKLQTTSAHHLKTWSPLKMPAAPDVHGKVPGRF